MLGIGDKVVFELGSITCYERPIKTDVGITVTGIFWKDAASPQGYGPFASAYEAMKHYEFILKTFTDAKSASDDGTAGQLIRIDFAQKRRLK